MDDQTWAFLWARMGADLQGLRPLEVGVCLRIIIYMAQTRRAKIANDDRLLRQICGCHHHTWSKVKKQIGGVFTIRRTTLTYEPLAAYLCQKGVKNTVKKTSKTMSKNSADLFDSANGLEENSSSYPGLYTGVKAGVHTGVHTGVNARKSLIGTPPPSPSPSLSPKPPITTPSSSTPPTTSTRARGEFFDLKGHNWETLRPRMIEAARGSVAPAARFIFRPWKIVPWLHDGIEIETILSAIAEASVDLRPGSVKSWEFFDGSVRNYHHGGSTGARSLRSRPIIDPSEIRKGLTDGNED